ncbi:mucin-17-like [Rhipicephalus sanguineus]|uniref:mucin-17-like n=1 Tax=Rhipicephalus sanguineus TaxID=34632 RepID=UPI0020C275FD|nr:mucin-17-like [Rhipicephalus sanguineus]
MLLLKRLLIRLDSSMPYSATLVPLLEMLADVWNALTTTTTRKCFQHAYRIPGCSIDTSPDYLPTEEGDETIVLSALQAHNIIADLNDYAATDDSLCVCREDTLDNLVAEVLPAQYSSESEEELGADTTAQALFHYIAQAAGVCCAATRPLSPTILELDERGHASEALWKDHSTQQSAMSAMRDSDSPATEPQFSAPSKRAPCAGHRRSHSLTTNSLVRHTLHVTPEQQAYVNGLIDKWEAQNPPKPFKPFELPVEFEVRFSALSNAAAEPLLPQRDDPGAPERAGPSEEHRSVSLPPTNREEQMDSTASRKRSREEVSSDDKEDEPRKQSAASPADPEPSDEDSVPTQCTEETGTEATTPASLDEAATAAVTSSAAQTTSASPSPVLFPSGETLVADAAAQDSGSPPPAPAAAETPTTPLDSLSAGAEAMDEATVDTCTQETTRKTTPVTAMAFLRSPTAGEQPASRKRKKKGRKTARKQHIPAAPLSTPAVSSSAGPSAPPADPVTTGRPPALAPAVTSTPRASQTRKITTAALPVDPAVVGTVLFRPSAPGGSFHGTPRPSIAQALPSHPGVADIRVNHHRNIVAVDATSQECLTLLLALPAPSRSLRAPSAIKVRK